VETFDTISPGRIAPSLSFDPRYFLTRIATLQYNYDDLNYRLCIYDLKTKKILKSVESYLSHSGEKFMRCNFSKDGLLIAGGCQDQDDLVESHLKFCSSP
jgi:hypothetical protein